MPVHNHGTEDGPGLACRETRQPDGSLKGECLNEVELLPLTAIIDGEKVVIGEVVMDDKEILGQVKPEYMHLFGIQDTPFSVSIHENNATVITDAAKAFAADMQSYIKENTDGRS
jgi:hypothetical protein